MDDTKEKIEGAVNTDKTENKKDWFSP
jgi:hypothetical protein